MKRSLSTVGTGGMMTGKGKHAGAVEIARTEKANVQTEREHFATDAIQGDISTTPVQGEELARRGEDQPHPQEQTKQASVARRADPVHPNPHRLADPRRTAVRSA